MLSKTLLPTKSNIFFLFFFATSTIYSFDHSYYITHNNLDFDIRNFSCALNHFATVGRKLGLSATGTYAENTNFDWEYYVTHNQLASITNELDAYQHYVIDGQQQNLPYCKSFDIMILLHLYDLDLMDEIVGKINYFINNNPHNTYRIKINIPITERILELPDFCVDYNDIAESDACTFIESKISTLCENLHQLIKKPLYASTLYHVHNYLQKSFVLSPQKVQIVFSENKGMDIGGFFVLLDEMNKENTTFDYLIKLHTKRGPLHDHVAYFYQTWRSCLMSFLNLKINKTLRIYDAIYPFKMSSTSDPERDNPVFIEKQQYVHSLVNIPFGAPYTFCPGTVFVVPYAFFNVIKEWHLKTLYTLLQEGRSESAYEHVFERLFGNVGEQVSTNIACFEHIPRGCLANYDNL